MAELPQRHTIRWQGYDYAQCGAYYLTIVTDDRSPLFGRIVDGVMHPSPIGILAQRCWDAIPEHMPHVGVGEFVVMPNHVHGIVVIRERLVDVRGRAMDGASDVGRVGADHDRPDTIQRPDTMPERNSMPQTGTPDPTNDGPNNAMANAPHAQMRADHDRPLRQPAPPANTTGRTMPIVPVGSLGRIVRAYKSAVTRMAYHDGSLPHGTPVWQRNYWDRVIRDDAEHERIADYIRDNPANWKGDRFNR
jgi:putative transposase